MRGLLPAQLEEFAHNEIPNTKFLFRSIGGEDQTFTWLINDVSGLGAPSSTLIPRQGNEIQPIGLHWNCRTRHSDNNWVPHAMYIVYDNNPDGLLHNAADVMQSLTSRLVNHYFRNRYVILEIIAFDEPPYIPAVGAHFQGQSGYIDLRHLPLQTFKGASNVIGNMETGVIFAFLATTSVSCTAFLETHYIFTDE